MDTITYTFTPRPGHTLHGRSIHALGLHGFLYNITAQTDRAESDWLHQHPSPRPFTSVPLYTNDGTLAGIRLAALTERVAALFKRTGEWFVQQERPCHLGGQEFIIQNSHTVPGPSWPQLALSEPIRELRLQFLSPTAFRQGPGHLPLPLPHNVFGTAVRLWEAFAPPMMTLPPNWLDWCARNIFIIHHKIETVTVDISQKERFTGFVGEVWYQAHRGDDLYLRAWQALAELTTFCGTGHKATMGMGAVERLY